jgi:catechol 2,3-dioxygenase-like lactoylglutathione lyase family enzyme
MKVMPIRFVHDVQASRQFYEALGLAASGGPPNDYWQELSGSGGVLALHHATDDGRDVELSLVTDEPLEAVVTRLDGYGIPHGDIADEQFGRSLRVTDPDGAVIQINEHGGEQ